MVRSLPKVRPLLGDRQGSQWETGESVLTLDREGSREPCVTPLSASVGARDDWMSSRRLGGWGVCPRLIGSSRGHPCLIIGSSCLWDIGCDRGNYFPSGFLSGGFSPVFQQNCTPKLEPNLFPQELGALGRGFWSFWVDQINPLGPWWSCSKSDGENTDEKFTSWVCASPGGLERLGENYLFLNVYMCYLYKRHQ